MYIFRYVGNLKENSVEGTTVKFIEDGQIIEGFLQV